MSGAGTTFAPSIEQADLRDLARTVANDVYRPLAREWDSSRQPLPVEERKRLAELGLLGVALPKEHGGLGLGLWDALIVIEEFAKVCLPPAFAIFEANTGPARVVDLFGSATQKAKWLPRVVEGDVTIAVSISEPDAGSAATDVATAAAFDGTEWTLNGTKRWCSGAGHAECYLVYARMTAEPGSRGIGALLVERDRAGLSFGPQEDLMGFHGIASADMFFDDVRLPAENLVVPVGGFRSLFTAFSIERLGNATMSLGIGQRCLEQAAAHVRDRRQFGRPIAEFQLVQATIADMVMQVEAARLLIQRAAVGAGTGAPVALEASVAKCFANEMAKRVSDQAIQLLGGYGYSAEYEVERMHRDAHGWALAGGTTNIQRLRIASEFLGQKYSQRA